MDGNEDVGDEGTFSHCGESLGSLLVAPGCGGPEPADGAERCARAFELELVVGCGCGWFCYVQMNGKWAGLRDKACAHAREAESEERKRWSCQQRDQGRM